MSISMKYVLILSMLNHQDCMTEHYVNLKTDTHQMMTYGCLLKHKLKVPKPLIVWFPQLHNV